MTRSRAFDWMIGALAMLFVLAIVGGILWFSITAPDSGPDQVSSTPPELNVPSAPEPPGDLAADETWLGDIDVSSDIVVLPETSLFDVEAQGHGARSGPDGVVVDRLDVIATVPFATVEAEIGSDSRVSAAADGKASIERSVEVLGRQFDIVATGTVSASNGLLVVEPVSINLGGGSEALSRVIGDAVRQIVTIEQPIAGLPPNLVLQDVQVQADGFRVELAGQDVVLADGNS